MEEITYRRGQDLDLAQVIALYRASTLGERRPVDDAPAMAAMLAHASLIVTAWRGEELVGLARTLTDFAYVGYLADLAVHADCQRRGIGKRLLAETRRHLGAHCKLVLIAAPRAVAYYPKLGFTPVESAWQLPGEDPLRP